MSVTAGWLTPSELASELSRPGAPVTAKWVRERMRAGDIPSVTIGSRRFFSPQCRAELERRAVSAPAPSPSPDVGWGLRTRRAST